MSLFYLLCELCSKECELCADLGEERYGGEDDSEGIEPEFRGLVLRQHLQVLVRLVKVPVQDHLQ